MSPRRRASSCSTSGTGGEYTQTDIAALSNVSRAAVYRELQQRRVAFLANCEAHIF